MIKALYSKLNPLEKSEYTLLALMVIAISIHWSVAIWALCLLLVHTLVKIIACRHAGNPALSNMGRAALWTMVAYFAIYTISLTYSTDISEGVDVVTRRLPFFIMPLVALASDWRYLTWPRIRALLHLFCAALVVRFLVFLSIRYINLLTLGQSMHFISGAAFDPMHHTYLAMYVLFVLTFLYFDGAAHWHSMKRQTRIWLVAAALLLCADLIFIQSRTGILGLIVLAVVAWCHFVFVLKHVKTGLIALCLGLCMSAGVYSALPDSALRLTETVQDVTTGKHDDIRIYISQTARQAIAENMPFGVGAGDRCATLQQHYNLNPINERLRDATFNPHNQYLDSLLATGIPGLIIMLALFLLPPISFLIRRQKSNTSAHCNIPRLTIRQWTLAALVGWVAFTCLFESALERQMAITFFSLFYCLLLPYATPAPAAPSDEVMLPLPTSQRNK